MENDQKKAQSQQESANPEQRLQKTAKYLMVEAVTEFAFIIAVPLLAFIYAGKWLDTRTNRHFYVILGILFALVFSATSIGVRINQFKKKLK